MSKDIKEVIAKTSEVASGVVGALGSVVSMFFPKVSGGVVLAGKVLDKLSQIDDKEAENNVLGLTATAEALDNLLADLQSGKELNKDEVRKLLEQAAQNIKSIDASLDKFYKLIS